MKTSLDKTQATKDHADIANHYNRLPLAFEKVDPDLTSYVVGRAVDALFVRSPERGKPTSARTRWPE